jgi:hypothetical protein
MNNYNISNKCSGTKLLLAPGLNRIDCNAPSLVINYRNTYL